MSHVRIIKKYPNRRLYDTEISSYVTLEDVRQLIVDKEDFVVRDARSGNDITRGVLMQIIAEHEEHGQPIFTTELLTQVIRFRGDSLQGHLGSFLERSLQFFLEQQQNVRGQIGQLVGQAPWSLLNQLAERNLELWRSFQQGLGGGTGATPPRKPARPAAKPRTR
ncbi:polyhydroxyalkanoate synthesis repressor PhaR [Arenimonas sp.]|uniref:polyhydroxyalkanoate synthesis repressor PhaR n=1 Tax=Arenimonas sp. TaxID=1872635 RepID=UPI0035B3E00D